MSDIAKLLEKIELREKELVFERKVAFSRLNENMDLRKKNIKLETKLTHYKAVSDENYRDMIDVPDAIVRKIYKVARMISHAGLRSIQMVADAAGVHALLPGKNSMR